MAVTSLDDARALLYGYPPESFVAERDRLVKELRAAKNRDLANDVKALRKPVAIAAEVNRIVRADPGAVDLVLQAAELLRAGQAGLLEDQGVNVAELQQHYRAAIKALAQQATSRPADVRAVLEAATIDIDSHDALRTGSLVVVPEPASIFGIAGAPPVPEDELALRRAKRNAKTEKTTDASDNVAHPTGDEAIDREAEDSAAADALLQAEVAAAKKLAAKQAAEEEKRLREAEKAAEKAAKAAEKAAKKERANQRKALAKQHRQALRAQLDALEAHEAATTRAAEQAVTAAELEQEVVDLEQQLAERRDSLAQVRQDQAEAVVARDAASEAAEKAEAEVLHLAGALDALGTD